MNATQQILRRFGRSTGARTRSTASDCGVVNFVDEVVNEVVKSHPGLRKPELVPLVGKSRVTVERTLASLISSGRIEFRGASKNGGAMSFQVKDKV